MRFGRFEVIATRTSPVAGVHVGFSLRAFVPDAIRMTASKLESPLLFGNIPERSANWVVEVQPATS